MRTKERLQHQIDKANESIAKLEMNREDLNEHGFWALGYWKGRLSILEEWLDEVEESSLADGGQNV